jgi:cytochrome o ubiquinol oxidase subunit 2
VVPAGSPIEFDVTSATVMNAFFVPQLGTQIYAMPGMTTRVNLMADRAGLYPGLSSHFSGDGFSDMRFDVRAVAPAEFERWVERVRSGSQTLDRDAYQALARPARTVGVTTYRAFDDRLFQDILSLSTPAIRPPER